MVTVFPVNAKKSLIFKPNEEIKLKLYDTPQELADCLFSRSSDARQGGYMDKKVQSLVRKRGVWAVGYEPDLTVHLWAKPKIPFDVLVHNIGVALGGIVYRPVEPDESDGEGEPYAREEEADAFGWIAAQSYRWAHAVKVHLAALSGGFSPSKNQP